MSADKNYKLYTIVIYIFYWILPTILIVISYIAIIVTFKRSSLSLSKLASHSALSASPATLTTTTCSSTNFATSADTASRVAAVSTTTTSLVTNCSGATTSAGNPISASIACQRWRNVQRASSRRKLFAFPPRLQSRVFSSRTQMNLQQTRVEELVEPTNAKPVSIAGQSLLFDSQELDEALHQVSSSQQQQQQFQVSSLAADSPTSLVSDSQCWMPTTDTTNASPNETSTFFGRSSCVDCGNCRLLACTNNSQLCCKAQHSKHQAVHHKTTKNNNTRDAIQSQPQSASQIKHSQQVQWQEQSARTRLHQDSNAQRQMTARAALQYRLARMSLYLILLWLVSWTPIASLAMLNSIFCSSMSATAVFFASTMTKLGPAFDVFIYGVSHPKIKSSFKRLIRSVLKFEHLQAALGVQVSQVDGRQAASELILQNKLRNRADNSACKRTGEQRAFQASSSLQGRRRFNTAKIAASFTAAATATVAADDNHEPEACKCSVR